MVEIDGQFRYIRKDGAFLTDESYPLAGGFSHGLAPVLKVEKWGYINSRGEVAIDYQFYWAEEFKEDFAAIAVLSEDGMHSKYGFINTDGKVMIEPEYDFAESFSEGVMM